MENFLAAVPQTVTDFVKKLSDAILNPLIFLMFAVAVVIFLWGIVEFIRNLDNEDGRKTGAQHMIWGIIGMAIMLSAYAIKSVIEGTVNAL